MRLARQPSQPADDRCGAIELSVRNSFATQARVTDEMTYGKLIGLPGTPKSDGRTAVNPGVDHRRRERLDLGRDAGDLFDDDDGRAARAMPSLIR